MTVHAVCKTFVCIHETNSAFREQLHQIKSHQNSTSARILSQLQQQLSTPSLILQKSVRKRDTFKFPYIELRQHLKLSSFHTKRLFRFPLSFLTFSVPRLIWTKLRRGNPFYKFPVTPQVLLLHSINADMSFRLSLFLTLSSCRDSFSIFTVRLNRCW